MIGNCYCTRDCLVGKGSDELASQRESGDVGKEPRHNYFRYFFSRQTLLSTLETFPAYMSVPGISLGQPSCQRALHSPTKNMCRGSKFEVLVLEYLVAKLVFRQCGQ